VNQLLQQQAEEIFRMNVLLEKDNQLLHQDIDKVTHDRLMLAEVDFDEFSKIYPDRETGFKFLAELKWSKGTTAASAAAYNIATATYLTAAVVPNSGMKNLLSRILSCRIPVSQLTKRFM
jgi:hypothetical protein